MSQGPVSGVFKRVSLIAMAAFLVACQPSAETPQEQEYTWVHEVSDLPADPDVRYGQLDNGLRYAIRQNDTPPNVASVRLVFNAGSLAEAEDQRGLAHFIEHMAFNGSAEVPEGEMVPLLERHGLQFGPDTNAFTGYETVGYQLDIPEVDEETLDTALFLMRQTASELLMDSEAIDRERGVILSEERFRNTPIRRWNTALWRFRLPDSLVPDRDAIGTVDVIETAQRERFVDYYENFYVPQRGMLVVVGDVDPDAIEAKIRDEFADWQSIEDPRGDPDTGSVTEGRPLSVGYFHDPEIYTIFTVDAVRPHEDELDTTQARFENNLANLGDAILSRRFATLTSSGTSPLIQASANHGSDFEIADRATVLAIM
ncbi:MAG: peptidase M16, partial [Oceanicaulis sp.]|nr:peptidase M16 [Oceanicaulis sp.]